MADDTTGMKRAQGGDQQAKEAGRVRRGLNFLKRGANKGLEYVPLSPQRGRMKREEQARMTGAAVSQGIADGNERLIQALREGANIQNEEETVERGVTPKGMGEATGNHIHELNMELIAAIRQGQRRTGSESAMPIRIREVVSTNQVINVINNGTVQTPIEEVDTAFATRMKDVRSRLAQELARGAVGDVNAERMDILYSALAGMKYLRDENGDVIYHTDQAGNKVPTVFWNRRAWPHETPIPPEALLSFIEGVAQRKHPGQEGEFIGSVLKGLTETRTVCSSTQEEALRYLVDPDYADEYLERMSAEPIDRAVESFTGLVRRILLTPADEMVVLDLEREASDHGSENNEKPRVPGLGYFVDVEGFGPCRVDNADEAAEAMQELGEASEALGGDVLENLGNQRAQVLGELGDALTARRKADEKKQQVTDVREAVKNGKTINVTEDQLQQAEADADNERADADQKVQDLEEKLRTIDELLERYNELRRNLGGMQAAERERFDELLVTCSNEFRARILEGTEISESMINDLAQKMDNLLPNLTVLGLAEDARALLDAREVAHQYAPEQETRPITEEQLKEALIAGNIDKATYDALMETLRRGDDVDVNPFMYKKDEFERKIDAFEEKIENAVLPEEVKKRFRAVAKAMRAKRYYARGELENELRSIEEDSAYPLRQAAKVAVEDLNKKTPEKAGKIPDAQFIIARMVYEAHSKELGSLSSTREGRWERWKNKLMWVFTTEFWVGKGKKHRRPGEERGGVFPAFYRKAIRGDVEDVGNFSERVVGRNPKTRKPYRYRWYLRGIRGVVKLVLKGMLVYGGIVAALNAPANPALTRNWYSPLWPGNWNNASYYVEHFARWPWMWVKPITPELSRKRIIDDSYDIPSRLVHRPARYYTQAYNVTADERLDWLRKNAERFPVKTASKEEWGTLRYFRSSSGGVLRYLQERTTLKRVVSIEELPEDPRTLSKPRRGGETARKEAETVEPTKDEKKESKGKKAEEQAEEQKPEEEMAWYQYAWPGNWFGSDERGEEEVDQMRKDRDDFKMMRAYGQTVPDSCKALGIDSVVEDPKTPEDENDVQDYQPLTRNRHGGREYDAKRVDRWEPGYPFACTLAMGTEPVGDNFVVNRQKADGFIDYLRQQEKNGANVSYGYMVKNTAQFVQKGFLVTKSRAMVMEKFGITDIEVVDIITAQGPERMEKLLLHPLVYERTEGEGVEKAERIGSQHMDAFLQSMGSRIKSAYPGRDPMRDRLGDSELEAQFNATLATGRSNGWVTDITEDYRRQKLTEQLSELKLSEKTAYALLAPGNEGIRNLLGQFADSKTYRLKVTVLEGFIQELQEHKRRGGDVNDYSPFGEPAGSRAAWAISAGYIVKSEVFEGVGTAATGESTSASQMQKFYEGEEGFNGIVDGMMERLFTDEGEDAELAQGAYGGDQEKTKQAIREELYRLLTAEDTRSAQKRKSYGLEVSTEDGELKVEVTDRGKARKNIKNHVVKFLGEQGQ